MGTNLTSRLRAIPADRIAIDAATTIVVCTGATIVLTITAGSLPGLGFALLAALWLYAVPQLIQVLALQLIVPRAGIALRAVGMLIIWWACATVQWFAIGIRPQSWPDAGSITVFLSAVAVMLPLAAVRLVLVALNARSARRERIA